MHFVVAKNDVKCAWCQSFILRNEDMVQNFQKGSNGFCRVISFHTGCYIPWHTDMFNQKWANWKHTAGNTQRSKMGRPITAVQTKERKIHNLQALISHHKKAGNTIKVKILEGKLATLGGHSILL
jgi:hypothetical protein